MDKSELELGKKYIHRNRGEGVYTLACFRLEAVNPDPTSVYLYFSGADIQEVSLTLIKKET